MHARKVVHVIEEANGRHHPTFTTAAEHLAQVLVDAQHRKLGTPGAELNEVDHAKLDEAETLLRECLAAREKVEQRRQEKERGIMARLFGSSKSACRSAMVCALHSSMHAWNRWLRTERCSGWCRHATAWQA